MDTTQSYTCCIAGFKPLSVLIEQLSRTSKDNRIHDTIQSATESNIMQHSQVDSTLPPRLFYNNLGSGNRECLFC